MATTDFISTSNGSAQSAGAARFFAQAHMQEAQRIALHKLKGLSTEQQHLSTATTTKTVKTN